MNPTRDELTAAIKTARSIQEALSKGNLYPQASKSFNIAQRFLLLCEDILAAMPAEEKDDRADWSGHDRAKVGLGTVPEPETSLIQNVFENIIKPHAKPHGSVLGDEHMPVSVKREAPNA